MISNFNKQPYFDDFSKEKNFVRVLFKPSHPVQARELNQIQSIQHNQVMQFANHIFKHGARVNGTPPKNLYTPYVTLERISPWDNKKLDIKKIEAAKKIRGSVSLIEALVLKAIPEEGDDPPTLYVNYTITAVDQKTHVFLDGEIIEIVDDNDIVTYKAKVRCPKCKESNDKTPDIPPTGRGILWNIPESTYYVNGYFIDVQQDLLVGEKYTVDKESYVVGFDIVEDIVTAEDDPSLFDNALGYPNYAAKGADRARIRLIPTIRTVDIEDGETFVTLARVEKGVIQFIRTRTDYSAIMDMLAERTYDESGNYTVKPFLVRFVEHLKKSPDDPNGRLTLDEGGDEKLMVAVVSPGKAYVKGYLVEKTKESMFPMLKSRETKKLRGFYNRTSSLNYIIIELQKGSFFSPNSLMIGSSIFTNEYVDLYDGESSGGLPTGAVIGKLKAYDVEYHSTINDKDRYKLYFVEIVMNQGKSFDMVKSLYRTSDVTFIAHTVLIS